MSFELPNKVNATESTGPRWSGAAVLVESMLLLVFLIASLAVFTQMFSTSVTKADESEQLTAAVAAASDTAERFAAYPQHANGEYAVGDLVVVCDVQSEARKAGTLYRAQIDVYADGAAGAAGAGAAGAGAADSTSDNDDAKRGEPVYSITTSRFVSEVI